MNTDTKSECKVYLALPMNGRQGEQVYREAQSMRSWLQARKPEKVIDVTNWEDICKLRQQSLIDDWAGNPLTIMAKCLEQIAESDMVIFSEDGWNGEWWDSIRHTWAKSKGCVIEKKLCKLYGIPTAVIPNGGPLIGRSLCIDADRLELMESE